MHLANQILVMALILLFGRQATANNNFFLPGDAFYYSEPSHKWFENLAATENPIVQYQRPRKGPGGRFCGYAGYNKMQLNNFTPDMRANLVKAYQKLRAQYPQNFDMHQRTTLKMEDGKLVTSSEKELSRVEHNLVSMLIYNRDFDLAKFRPLFRYNENWADAAAAFGHPRDHVAYDFFIDDSNSITDDWRDSALVKPLRFTTPEQTEKQPRLKNVVISIDCEDIQVLLFPTSLYEDMAFPNENFVHRLTSGNRTQQSNQAMSGGVFSIQENTNAQTDADNDSVQRAEETVPYFAYRATIESCEILKPVKGHWTVADK